MFYYLSCFCSNSLLIECIITIIKLLPKFVVRKTKGGCHLDNLIVLHQTEHIVFSGFFLFLFIPGDNQIWKCAKHKSCRVMAIRGNEQMYKYLKDVEGKRCRKWNLPVEELRKRIFLFFLYIGTSSYV